MSVFGPKQNENVIIGNALATETTVATFVSAASDKEIGVFSKDGGAVAAGKKFYVLQKTNGNAAKGLNYEFSDEIDPKLVDQIVVKKYAPEVQKVVTVTFDSTVAINTAYEVMIRLYNDSGTLSVENFRHITGSYVTGETAPTLATVIAGVKDSLEKSLAKEGESLFTITSTATTLVITSVSQPVVVGKKDGRLVEFDVEVFSRDEDLNRSNTGLLSAATTTESKKGVGTGKYAVNLEWFTKGYKYDVYREAAYPVNFDTPYYADGTLAYNVIHIKYKYQRTSTVVENQDKVLTILVAEAGGAVAVTNAIAAKLATATGITVTVLS